MLNATLLGWEVLVLTFAHGAAVHNYEKWVCAELGGVTEKISFSPETGVAPQKATAAP